jgi:hypothetical protein
MGGARRDPCSHVAHCKPPTKESVTLAAARPGALSSLSSFHSLHSSLLLLPKPHHPTASDINTIQFCSLDLATIARRSAIPSPPPPAVLAHSVRADLVWIGGSSVQSLPSVAPLGPGASDRPTVDRTVARWSRLAGKSLLPATSIIPPSYSKLPHLPHLGLLAWPRSSRDRR